MDKVGEVTQLGIPGPRNGQLILVTDYANKTVSLIEVSPSAGNGNRLVVWEVQEYTKVAP